MDKLIELKAKAYDLIATIQLYQKELQTVNENISKLINEGQNEKS